jgi:hypothetical protein
MTARAQVCYKKSPWFIRLRLLQEMDVDPDSDNGDDAGAIEMDFDDYGNDQDEEDSDDSIPAQGSGRRDKRRWRHSPGRAPKPSSLHPDDPANFLKLCEALKILVAREITDDQIETARGLLQSYCQELVYVSCSKPYSSDS